MVCISNACANNLYSIAGGLGYPGDLAGWLLHPLTPKRDKKIYYAHHLQPKVVLLTSFGFEVCTMRYSQIECHHHNFNFNCTFALGNQYKCQTAAILNV